MLLSVGEEVTLHVSGGGRAARTSEGDLVPTVSGALQNLDLRAVGDGGQRLIAGTGTGTHKHAFPVFSPEEEVVPLPDEEDAEDVEELLCVPTLHRTMHTPFLVPSVTSTLTVPWEMAVTLPLLSTDAMPSSSLIQV